MIDVSENKLPQLSTMNNLLITRINKDEGRPACEIHEILLGNSVRVALLLAGTPSTVRYPAVTGAER